MKKQIFLLIFISLFLISFTSAVVPTNCQASVIALNTVDVDIGQGFTKPYIQLTVVAGQGSDCLLVSWTKDQLNNALQQGDANTKQYVATKDALSFGYIKLDKYNRIWDIATKTGSFCDASAPNTGNCYQLYNLRREPAREIGQLGTCDINRCQTEFGFSNVVHAYKKPNDGNLLKDYCTCIDRQPTIMKGNFLDYYTDERDVSFAFTGLSLFEQTITQASGRGTIPSTVINDGLGNRKVLIQWVGDLYGGVSVTKPLAYEPYYDQRAGEGLWHFQRTENWQNLVNSYYSYLNGIKGTNDDTTVDFYINGLNNAYNSYLKANEAAYIQEYINSVPVVKGLTIPNKNNLNTADLSLDLSTQPNTFPVFTMFLDAEWVGIKKLVTQPRAVCSQNSVQLNSGLNTDIGITIFNDANNGGQIDGQVTCTNNINALLTPTSYSYSGQGSNTASLRVSGVATGTTDNYGSCTFVAKDHTNPSLTSSCIVQVQVKALACTIGDRKCSPDGTQLYNCVNNQWSASNCNFGCDFISNQCKPQPNPQCPTTCSTDANCNPVCGTDYKCYNNRCQPKENPAECKDCMAWGLNIFKKTENQCLAKSSIIETKWYDPKTWVGYSGLLSQDNICPIQILMWVIIIAILSIVVIAIITMSKRKKR